jgi:hypothetical protein
MGHTRCSGKVPSAEKTGFSAAAERNKVVLMEEISRNKFFEDFDSEVESLETGLAASEDLIMEQILENINTTPIGQVLKKIASLPEVRREKVLDVRRQLNEGRYELSERLDLALDKVLEELTA